MAAARKLAAILPADIIGYLAEGGGRGGTARAVYDQHEAAVRYRSSPNEKQADVARHPFGKVNNPGRKMKTLRPQIVAPS